MERFHTLFWLIVASGAVVVLIIVFALRLAASVLQELPA